MGSVVGTDGDRERRRGRWVGYKVVHRFGDSYSCGCFYTNWPKKFLATWGPLFSPSLQTRAQKKALENSDRGPSGERDKRHSQKGLLKQVALVQVG